MSPGILARWLDPVVGLLFPAVCPICDARPAEPEPRPFCPACWLALPRTRTPVCARCGRGFPGLPPGGLCGSCRGAGGPLAFVRAAGAYRGGMRLAVQALKFGHRPALASPLGTLLADQSRRLLPFPGSRTLTSEALVPLPLHPTRLASRGYNQAALLATACGRDLGLPVWDHALRRRRATRPQTELAAAARRANVAGAFDVPHPSRVDGRRLLLIDDVLTTGATATAAAAALCAAGAAEVGVLVLARADEP